MSLSQRAYFATGCFWGAERKFWQTKGVISTSVGYQGGHWDRPDYDLVTTGITGHAETVEVTFNPDEISYQELLRIFFTMHDPTAPNRQGNDIGTQYRSAVFTTSDEQFAELLEVREIYQDALTKAGYGKIVTERRDANIYPYWPAEEEHQHYLAKNPDGYNCHTATGVPFPPFQGTQ